MRYTFTVVSETLRRGGDARGERLVDSAAKRREQEGWDFAIGLTDLPVHQDSRPIVAELNRDAGTALLVVPALKVFNPADQARDIATGLIREWAAGGRVDEGTYSLLYAQARALLSAVSVNENTIPNQSFANREMLRTSIAILLIAP
jgi:hypothetical protein